MLDLYVRKGNVPTDPEIAALAKLTGRTEASIAMRLGNFMHVDPRSPNEGLAGGWAQCDPLFREFDGVPDLLAEEAASARQRLQSFALSSTESSVARTKRSKPGPNTLDSDPSSSRDFRGPMMPTPAGIGCMALCGCAVFFVMLCGIVGIVTNVNRFVR